MRNVLQWRQRARGVEAALWLRSSTQASSLLWPDHHQSASSIAAIVAVAVKSRELREGVLYLIHSFFMAQTLASSPSYFATSSFSPSDEPVRLASLTGSLLNALHLVSVGSLCASHSSTSVIPRHRQSSRRIPGMMNETRM